ncbi:MAG: hypothetical protein K8T91_02250 [Planctomycetes bacterium]|nr:hypothetical protein [Planctomycetota bacterium]
METKATPKHRRVQYSMRTLLLLTAGFAVWFAWYSHEATQQKEAVARITKLGGEVAYDFQAEGIKQPRHWPVGIVDSLGIDYFASVERLSLFKPNITDTELKHIKVLTKLKGLEIIGQDITDDGLKNLKGLRELTLLSLYLSNITDTGLENVKGLTALRVLHVNSDNNNITDAGLEHLEGLKALQVLSLDSTQQVTAAGVARLQNTLPNCTIHWTHRKKLIEP